MKFMTIDREITIGDIVLSNSIWTELDLDVLQKSDSQKLLSLLSSNQIVVANSSGAPCQNTAKQLIFRLLTK